MPRVGQGGTAPLRSFVTDEDGNPVDVVDYTLTVLDPFLSIVSGFPITFSGITHEALGQYLYSWHVSGSQALGSGYRVQWSGETADGPIFGEEIWDVVLPDLVSFNVPGPIPDAYLSPGRFGLMDTGIKLPPAVQLSLILQEASAIADAYCNVPKEFSFFGGFVVDEAHPWRYPLTNMDRGERRIYPLRKPVRSVVGLRILVSAGAYARLETSTLVINGIENWVEVTSLSLASSSGLFGVSGWVVPIGGLSNPVALLSYNYGRTYEETDRNLILTPVTKVYQAPHGAWTNDPVVIKANGSVVDIGTNPYTVDTEEGWVTFTGSVPAGKLTASYTHLLPRDIPLAVGYIAAYLIGEANLRAKGMSGLGSIKVGEIQLAKARSQPLVLGLDTLVPNAALILSGYRFWSMG